MLLLFFMALFLADIMNLDFLDAHFGNIFCPDFDTFELLLFSRKEIFTTGI